MHTYRIRAVVRFGVTCTYRKKIQADNPALAMSALYTWVRAMGGNVEDIMSVHIRRGRR